jgi:hypothetical protein
MEIEIRDGGSVLNVRWKLKLQMEKAAFLM